MTADLPREEEWETYTIRVKKDHEWPHHGSDIEFNGCRYKRIDIAEKPVDAEVLRICEKTKEAIEYRKRLIDNNFDARPHVVLSIEDAEILMCYVLPRSIPASDVSEAIEHFNGGNSIPSFCGESYGHLRTLIRAATKNMGADCPDCRPRCADCYGDPG